MSYPFQTNDDRFYLHQRQKMVKEQILERGINENHVLEAMLKVPRHLFVPFQHRHGAYEDHPLPIGCGQTISQPFIVGYMTEMLGLRPQDKVLEIGTGCGYQTAVLAEITNEVYTIEIVEELAKLTSAMLLELGYRRVQVKHGDGFQGWPEAAPFDAIIVTAAPHDIPAKLVEQLAIGGRMIIPVGLEEQELYLIRKTEEGVEEKPVLSVRFVPMVKGSHFKE